MVEALMDKAGYRSVGRLSDEALLARLREHVGKGHVWQAELIAYLVEVEERRLDRVHACSSMWDFCTRKLGMSESEAQRRITAARIVRSFPQVLGYLERGAIHLCGLYALRGHLTRENVDALLREASGRSTRDIEAMTAARFPRPDAPPRIEPVAMQAPLPVASSEPHAASSQPLPALPPVARTRQRVEPLSATRYRVELTVSAETKVTLERIQDLMRHRNPSGDLETILDASLALLLAKLEKERLGKTSRPRKGKTANAKLPAPAEGDPPDRDRSAPDAPSTEARADLPLAEGSARPGYISRAVRREVFARDGERCTYVDADGDRCRARGLLELDHVHPRALEGSDDAANLRVRCRAHNALYAEQVFGREHVEWRIHLQRRKRTPAAPASPPTPSIQTAARALCGLGFREPEVRRALVLLETKLDTRLAPIDTLVREALLLLT